MLALNACALHMCDVHVLFSHEDRVILSYVLRAYIKSVVKFCQKAGREHLCKNPGSTC